MKRVWWAWFVALACASFPGLSWAQTGSVGEKSSPGATLSPSEIPAAWVAAPNWQPPAGLTTNNPPPTLGRVSYSAMPNAEVESSPSDRYVAPGKGYAPPDMSYCESCPPPPWVHRTGLFADILYLRARDAEVDYVVPINGAIVPPLVAPIQVGPVGVVDPDYTPAYRVGGTWALDECSSVVLTYTRFETTTSDAQTIDAPFVLRSLVLHPGTLNAGADFLDANANLGIDLHLADVDFRAVWDAGDLWVINYLLGARYANLNQDFNGTFTSTGSVDTLATNVNFDGGGIRVGLDGERHSGCGLLLYGRANASFVGGEFRGRYTQANDLTGTIVDTSWKSGRLVSILDLEIGAGWQNCNGRLRLSCGYVVSSWFNAVTSNEWIQSVQTNNFEGLGDTMTFDGLVGRVEYRF